MPARPAGPMKWPTTGWCSSDEGVGFVALTAEELALYTELGQQLSFTWAADELHDRYYEGEQRLRQLGLAVPPDLQRFVTIVNWPALVVDSVAERIKLKDFVRPGSEQIDQELLALWQANNLDSEQHTLWNDKLVYGRAFLAIGANEETAEFPLITVESPREMTVKIDPRTRRVVAALKVYQEPWADPRTRFAVLYTPDSTVWLAPDGLSGSWVGIDRDDHMLGRVPVVPFVNRRRTGRWFGVSEMRRAISLTDAAARSLTNLQIAGETHSVPQRWVSAVAKGDFADTEGKPLPVWQAYFSGIWATGNKDAKFGQFQASDLRNFSETVDFYGRLLAGIYGLPPQYMGQNTQNPSSAAAIREAKEGLIMRAEMHMSQQGDALCRALAIAERIKTGQWPDGNRIRARWFDPATPTFASRADAVSKLTGGVPILSREGAWDELDWSDERKAKERSYFDAQNSDPTLERVISGLTQPPADATA